MADSSAFEEPYAASESAAAVETTSETVVSEAERPVAKPAGAVRWQALALDILLVVVLVMGGALRFTGLNWDDYSHLHPDERFLTMVASSMRPVNSLSDFFNTETSTLNPHNVGYRFFVYGTVPMFITRYAAAGVDGIRAWEASDNETLVAISRWLVGSEVAQGPLYIFGSGYDQVHLLGRFLSASFDLAAVFIIYLIGATLYDRRVGLLAATFSALTVAYLQQAHFFTVDAMANFFVTLAIYFAVRVWKLDVRDGRVKLAPFVWFGVAYGLAVASRINTFPLALTVTLAGVALAWQVQGDRVIVRRIFTALVLAAVVSVVTFRVGQPYAFQGPNLWDVLPNEAWLDNIGSVGAQVSGDVDFPPNHQWTDRPAYIFPLRNMLGYGMGYALGITVWLGVLWGLWRGWLSIRKGGALRDEWTVHLIPVVWSLVYFGWQGQQWVKPIRYMLPAYPTLILLGSALVIWLWDVARTRAQANGGGVWRFAPVGAGTLGAVAVAGAFVWAVAFVQIYNRPLTRVAATEWIFQNIPAAMNMEIRTADGGTYMQPFAPAREYDSFVFVDNVRQTQSFVAAESGIIEALSIPLLNDPLNDEAQETFSVTLGGDPTGATWQSAGAFTGDLRTSVTSDGINVEITLDTPFFVQAGTTYYLSAWSDSLVEMTGGVNLELERLDASMGSQLVTIARDGELVLLDNKVRLASFVTLEGGELTGLTLGTVVDPLGDSDAETVRVAVSRNAEGTDVVTEGVFTGDLRATETAPWGQPVSVTFAEPYAVGEGELLFVSLWTEDSGAVQVRGSIIINESSWDDGLPLRHGGYDPFGGLYRGLTLELYDNDDVVKRDRMIDILNRGDYIVISSNRQTDSLVRLPTRYPMTIRYYEALFSGELGFELADEFISDPNFGPWVMPDQTAEEPFTVYDHPRVLIFEKTADYDPVRTAAILNEADLNAVIWMNPYQATKAPSAMLMDSTLVALQAAGGTWSQLFDRDGLLNTIQPVGALVWWLLLATMGWAVFPLLFAALPGLNDRGYAMARLAGLLLISWSVWLLASLRWLPNEGWVLWLAFGVWLALSSGAAMVQREALGAWLKANWRYVLLVEGLTVGLFMLFLWVRWNNPDLWHPAYGGEKPMDFAYFNAVLKSTYFPPYDPWLAGGYINYYYYGFVLVGAPVKMLGIIPSIAYNLALPSIYALTGIGAFGVAYNLVAATLKDESRRGLAVLGGVGALALAVLLGNLAQPDLIFEATRRMSDGWTPWVDVPVLAELQRLFYGLGKVFVEGQRFNIGTGQWYWNATRVIPTPPGDTQPITEFPYFTFLYADLHAHMISMPVTLLAMGWAVAAALNGARRERLSWVGQVAFWLVGGVAIGSLAAINTWDYPTYLVLGLVALAFAVGAQRNWQFDLDFVWAVVWRLGLLAVLSRVTFQPYHSAYGLGYSSAKLWEGSTTDIVSYLKIHGLFLFVVVTLLLVETRRVMRQTRLADIRQVWREVSTAALGIVLLVVVASAALAVVREVWVAVVAIPLMFWAGVLMIAPAQGDGTDGLRAVTENVPRRAVLALIGLAVTLTLVVELVVLDGDIGRMNTVFKFYLQTWLLLSVAAGAGLAWVWQARPTWHPVTRDAWVAGLATLVVIAALYPLTATPAKMSDRFSAATPRTLDGMAYMQYSQYADQGQDVPLEEDYAAIKWLQDNVEGSPRIVELSTVEYRWGSRVSINTGLPTVVGWSWHQRQQRAAAPTELVYRRVDETRQFYATPDIPYALDYLMRYEVDYIYAGVYERVYFGEFNNAGVDGLAKFTTLTREGVLELVYEQGQTRIYRVNRPALAAAYAETAMVGR